HLLNRTPHARKVDRDLIRKTVAQHRISANDRWRIGRCQDSLQTLRPTRIVPMSKDWLSEGTRRPTQRAPMVRRTSLRRVSSNSSKLSADSHSSHSTSRTAGRLSSETSTRPPSTFTTCICSVLTRKFRSLPQLGQVNVTYHSFRNRFYEMVEADAMHIWPE